MNDLLELVVKATTAAFDKAIDGAQKKAEDFRSKSEKDFEQVEKAVDRLGKSAKGMNNLFGEMAEAFVGTKIIEFLHSFVDAAAEDQARIESLNTALANMGIGTAQSGEELEKFGRQLSLVSGYSMPQLVQGMTNFINSGLSVSQTMYATSVAANIAAATGRNLADVQLAIQRAIATGSAASLSRLGIHLKGVNLATASLNTAMRAMGDTFKDQAANHAKTYEGAINRIAQQIDYLKTTFGTQFLNALADVANKFEYLIALFNALSPQAKQLISIVALAVGGFIALAAVLPLCLDLINHLREGVEALGTVMEFLAANPIGIVIMAIAALVAIIVIVVKNWKALSEAATSALAAISKEIGKFVDYAKEAFGGVAKVAAGIWLALTGHIQQGVASIKNGMAQAGHAIGDAFATGVHDGVNTAKTGFGELKTLGGNVAGYFKGMFAMGKVDMPKMPTVADPGGWGQFDRTKGGNAAGKTESNAISNAKDRIDAVLAAYDDRIQSHKDHLDQLDVREDRIKANVGDNGANRSQTSALENVDSERYHTNMALAASYTDKIHAERAAVESLAKERDRIAHNPALQAQYRELDAAVREHQKNINGLKLDVERANVAAEKALIDRNKLEEDYHKRAMERLKEESDARIAALQDQATTNADQREIAGLRLGRGYSEIDQLRDQVSNAQDNVTTTQARLDAANAQRQQTKSAQEIAEADRAVANAHRQLEQADVTLTKSQIKLQQAIDAASQNFTKKLGEAIGNAVPEINAYTEAVSTGQGAMAGWAGVIMQIVERTRSFKEIVQMLGNIFQLIARVLDAIFLPVVRVLNRVLTDIANVFIALYNSIATLVSLLGIHIQRLQYINSLLGDFGADSRPLLDVVHDIPTLKEFGSGSWGALQPDQYGTGNPLYNAVITQTNDQSGWFGKLIAFGAAMLAVDWLTHGKWFAELGSWFGQMWQHLGTLGQGIAEIGVGFSLLTSHTSGILGVLEKILGAIIIIQGIVTATGGGGLLGGGGGGILGFTSGAGFGGGGNGGGILSLLNSGNANPNAGGLSWLLSSHLGSATNGGPLTFLNNALGNGLGGAAAGYFLGGGVASLLGGNTQNGSIGGALGGGLASGLGLDALLGVTGPWGMLIGALAGGALGSLFGPKLNAHDNPDIKNTGTWGQDNANLWGAGFDGENAMHANGQSFNMDSQLAQMTGGKGLLQWLAQYISQTGGSGLTQQQIAEFQGLNVQTPVVNGKNGTLDLANGQSAYYSQLYSDAINAFQTAYQKSALGSAQNGISNTKPTNALDILKALIPSWDQLDAVTQGFIEQTLGMTDAMQQATQNAITPLVSAVQQSTTPVSGKPVQSPSQAIGNTLAPIIKGVLGGGGNGGTNIHVTQNNDLDATGIDDLDRVNASLGRNLQTLIRTQRYAI